MSDSIIEIKDVNKWFGDFQVLKDINLEVKAKEKIVVCGPSGSGKSTLLRCISRLTDATGGKIFIEGRDLLSLKNKELIDHQRNKSEIVKLVKEMFNQEKWGDEEYKKKLQELVVKDEELVKDVIKKIKLERGLE